MNPTVTAQQQQRARDIVAADPVVQKLAGSSTPTVSYQRPFITACAETLGAIEMVDIARAPSGDVEVTSWRCIDNVTESGIYRLSLAGTSQFGVEVDLRTGSIVAFEPLTKFDQMHRVAAAPHPNEGLPCRASD